MRHLIFSFLLILSSYSFSQKKVEKLKEYKANNGVTYKIGDSIKLNKGSNFNGSFNYVMIGGWAVSMNAEQNKLPSTNQGLILTVKKIRKYNRKRYKGVIFTVGGGNITNYLLMINEAIEACEITPCSEKNSFSGSESKYDKLKKLKELLDSGAITKEEFEKEKKKILKEN
jgi:hypothetical protein